MKLKSLILIAFAAILTLSFSFVASNRSERTTVIETASSAQEINEPIQGFISEDKF